jgi:phage-related protein
MKQLYWVGTSKKDLRAMPVSVMKKIGDLLFMVQEGLRPPNCKTLSGFGSASVCEIRETDRDGTYRAVYTTVVKDEIYVLHVFKKKSKQGIKTPREDMDLIRARLKEVLAS